MNNIPSEIIFKREPTITVRVLATCDVLIPHPEGGMSLNVMADWVALIAIAVRLDEGDNRSVMKFESSFLRTDDLRSHHWADFQKKVREWIQTNPLFYNGTMPAKVNKIQL